MKKGTLLLVLLTAFTLLFWSIIWSLLYHDQRWFSRMAISMVMFAAYGIMIRLDEIIKQKTQ